MINQLRFKRLALLSSALVLVWALLLAYTGRLSANTPQSKSAIETSGPTFYAHLPVSQHALPLVRLVAPTPGAGNRFGWDVAIDFNRAAVSELPIPSGATAFDTSGKVHLYQKLSSGWSLNRTFTSNEGAGADFYGYSIALSAKTMVVGAPYADAYGPNRGAIYIYERNATDWVLIRKQTGSNVTNNAHFGFNVAIEGERIIVGAPDEGATGAAYIFEKGDGSWPQTRRLVPMDTNAAIQFGAAVTLADGLAFAGAPADTDACQAAEQNCGSVYVFALNGTWAQEAELYAPAPFAEMKFGSNLTASVNILAVGHERSELKAVPTYYRAGPGAWGFDENVTSSEVTTVDEFGGSVTGEYGSRLLIGAWGTERNGSQTGAIYFYDRQGDAWVKVIRAMPAGSGAPSKLFGPSLALGGGQIAIGAAADDAMGVDAGAAYLSILADFYP